MVSTRLTRHGAVRRVGPDGTISGEDDATWEMHRSGIRDFAARFSTKIMHTMEYKRGQMRDNNLGYLVQGPGA